MSYPQRREVSIRAMYALSIVQNKPHRYFHIVSMDHDYHNCRIHPIGIADNLIFKGANISKTTFSYSRTKQRIIMRLNKKAKLLASLAFYI
jgi:hypothetical protein